MSIQVEKFNEIRTILITFSEPLQTPDDAQQALAESAAYKAELGAPICRILDFSQARLNLSNMMVGMAFERGKEGGTYDHDVANIFVGSDEMVELGVSALQGQEQYQGANVKGLYASPEEALDHARELMG